MSLLKYFYPGRRVASVYEIPFEDYRRSGVRGLIFDIDNTLVPHGAPADERVVALFERLHALGFEICLLSNNKEPRVAPFARAVGSGYICKGGKPGRRGYERAMRQTGTDQSNTLFIGDQLFTDVCGANFAGLYSVLVDPIDPKEEIQIVLKRYLERPLLWCYEHRKRR